MAGSTLSRRVSEFFGVALFGVALIWLISLTTYVPTDPVWFFSAGSGATPANFVGRVGAFLAELSFQLLGYASYLIPAAMVVIGWHYFWCRRLDAQYTKLVGAGLLFGCLSSLLSLAFGSVDVAGKPFRAGGYLGEWLASWMAEYLEPHGIDHRHSHAAVSRDRALDAVLAGPHVLVGDAGRPFWRLAHVRPDPKPA